MNTFLQKQVHFLSTGITILVLTICFLQQSFAENICGVSWKWSILPQIDGVEFLNTGTLENSQPNDLNDIIWNGSQLVTVGSDGKIFTSLDGVLWILTHQSSAFGLSHLRGITWDGSQFLVVGNNSILTSSDGMSWTYQSSNVSYRSSFNMSYISNIKDFSGITWNGSQFVAIGAFGTIVTSPDGVLWSRQELNSSNYFSHIIWSGTQFVIVGSEGTILTSPDGVSWSSQSSGITESLFSITWNENQFVVVGFNGTILTSSDGVSWVKQNSNTSENLYDITWADTQFVAVGNEGTILTSPDGMSWINQDSGTSEQLSAITWSGSQLIAVGLNGVILSSTCLSSVMKNNYDIRANNVNIFGTNYDFVLSYFQNPNDQDSHYWKLGTYSQSSSSVSGVSVQQNLNIHFAPIRALGDMWQATLKRYENPTDPDNLYWKLQSSTLW